MNSIAKRMSVELAVPLENILDVIRNGKKEHRKFKIPKKSGGHREIRQPTPELRMVQNWLSLRLLSHFPRSQVASAFHPGTSILDNAQTHSQNPYLIRIDLKDFFPSITLQDLQAKIAAHLQVLPQWSNHPDTFAVLDAACFDEKSTLPIGYPTSPEISNIVMLDFDAELIKLISSNVDVFGDAKLTRYADDFVFSTNKRGACSQFLDLFKQVVAQYTSPQLQLNNKKTKYMSRPGGSALVTGLRINNSGQVRVHPNYRDHVRLLLKLYAAGKLKLDENSSLVGHLAFIEHVDPQLFTKLSRRYFQYIRQIREGDPL